MQNRSRIAGTCLALCLLISFPADAQSIARDRTWFATGYASQWFSARVPSTTQRQGSQDAGFQSSYFVSVLLNNVLVSELRTEWPLISSVIAGSSIELEGQVGRHFGLQDQGEVTLALLWRSRDISVPLTNGRFNIGIGEGLSYALARPTYEGVVRDEEPRKFLNYLAFEAEFSHPLLPNISVVPRLHHRSGIFGLIAPRGSGSDFIGIGLRVTLQ